MSRRIEEIERRVGEMEKTVAVLRSMLPAAGSGCRAYEEASDPGVEDFSLSEDSDDATADCEAGRDCTYGVESRKPIGCPEPKAETPGLLHNHLGDPYSVKLVYPGFYESLDIEIPYCTIGFPSGKERLAKGVCEGTLFFIYITSPVRRVIGLTQALGPAEYRGDVDSARPWVATLEWIVGPKADGVSFADVGLEVRARTGDSVYAIPVSVATTMMERLGELCDLDHDEVERLRERFHHLGR